MIYISSYDSIYFRTDTDHLANHYSSIIPEYKNFVKVWCNVL